MEKYLLSIMGSSVDYYLDSDSYPEEGDFAHSRFLGAYAGGCPLNVGAVAASKGIPVKALDMLGNHDGISHRIVTLSTELTEGKSVRALK